VITYLPFLEDWGGADSGAEVEEHNEIFINQGTKGLAKMKSSETVAAAPVSPTKAAADGEEFAARRLSVVNPYGEDDDWEKLGDDDNEED